MEAIELSDDDDAFVKPPQPPCTSVSRGTASGTGVVSSKKMMLIKLMLIIVLLYHPR